MAINKNKPNLLYDASALPLYFGKNSSRSGIFFSAYNVLRELEKRHIFNIMLFFSYYQNGIVHQMKNDPYFSRFSYFIFYDKQQFSERIELIIFNKNNIKATANIFKKIIYTLKILKHFIFFLYYCLNNNLQVHTFRKILKKTDVFFSPDSFFHYEITKYKHIQKYGILHDTIPLLFTEYYTKYTTVFSTNDYINEYSSLRSLNKEHYYFCNSECTKHDYLKYYSNLLDEKKMIVIYHASSSDFYPYYDKIKLVAVLEKYKREYKNNDKYIFSLCTLEPRKNLIFTLNCFIKFIRKHNIDNLYFYIGGAQWDKFINLLEKSIDSLNEYRDKIVRLGYIDDEDVNILYSNALFFTFISQYEGFGVPPLEAMQAGTPVITSNNSSLPEVVGDAAIMIDYDSEEQCVKAFEDLYFNEDLRKYYIEKGLERTKLFSWEKTVNKMTDYILNSLPKK